MVTPNMTLPADSLCKQKAWAGEGQCEGWFMWLHQVIEWRVSEYHSTHCALNTQGTMVMISLIVSLLVSQLLSVFSNTVL